MNLGSLMKKSDYSNLGIITGIAKTNKMNKLLILLILFASFSIFMG